ncbi:MAG TPA: DUF2975 domain-containing protein [Longimicrobium sp.]|nr:DUF2975 domain-containing protein [Longimicrobium sp.]
MTIIDACVIDNQQVIDAFSQPYASMRRSNPDALTLTRRLLGVLIRLNQLMGAGILALLIATLVAEGPVMVALGVPAPDRNPRFVLGMRVIMVLGLAAVPVAHVVLTRLLTIVHTVGEGDPFIIENAGRLQRIAWAVLGLELLHLAIGAVAAGASTDQTPLDIDWGLSVTRWLAVLLLFVLARVFEQGARMREDLAGTV